MNSPGPEGPLTLRAALMAWCNPKLVEKARRLQQPFTAAALELGGRPNLGLARPNSGEIGYYRPESHEQKIQHSEIAWRALLADWRRMLETGSVQLLGSQTLPEPRAGSMNINGDWAADLDFDFVNNAVSGLGQRYVAVQAWCGGLPPSAEPDRPRLVEIDAITTDSFRKLTDDDVLILLEEYARRVVEDPASRLTMPVKPSFMPIILRKLRYRFATGEAIETLDAEARALAAWIKEKAPSHQTPAASSIENAIRFDYRQLKAQSKGMIG
jgi:hypothetical protein